MSSTHATGPVRPVTAMASDRRLAINRLILVLALAVLVIAAASFTGAMLLAGMGLGRGDTIAGNREVAMVIKFLVKFDVANEQTVAAWFSSVMMLLCAGLLLLIAAQNLGDIYHWAVLGVIFVGMSIDEMVAFHEMTSSPLRTILGGSGIFHYPWVILGIAFVLMVGLAYLPFLLRQPPWFRDRCVLAGAIFLSGALGFETLEGALVDFYPGLLFEIVVHLEDVLEFSGLLVFLHALLTYLRDRSQVVRVWLE